MPAEDTTPSPEDLGLEEGTHAPDEEVSNPSAAYPRQTFGLKDDSLADMSEIHYFVTVSHASQDVSLIQTNSEQNLDLMCTKIKHVWAKAAAGSIPSVLAAWLTTAAVECLHCRLAPLHNTNHQELCDKYKTFLGIDRQGSSISPFPARNTAQSGVFSSGHGLFCPAEAIIRGKSTQLEEPMQRVAIFEDPGKVVTVEDCADDRERAESILMDRLLTSVQRHLLPSEELRKEFLYEMNPLIKDIDTVYRAEDPNAMIQTSLVFGLQLLVESYKSFMFSDEKTPQTVNCRVQMLKFALEVKTALTNLRELRAFIHERCCDNHCRNRILSSRMWVLELDLMILTEQKGFDLYYQVPWVAGSQMLEILSQATRFGVELCNRSQIVWAVLHLYNLLRQCGALDKETILLEHLCSALGKQVFRGDPPQRDFLTRFQICNGGRLEFDRWTRHKSRQHPSDEDKPCSRSSKTWRVRMPRSDTDLANNNHELNPHQTSILAGLHSCRFRPLCANWSYVWHSMDRSKWPPTDETMDRVAHEIAAHPPVFALDHLERAVGPELQGDFPSARLNWFEIFLTVTEILSEVGKAAPVHCIECRRSPADAEFWVGAGCGAVERLLRRADEGGDEGMKDFADRYLGMVEPARNAICSAVRGEVFSVWYSCWVWG